MKCSNCGKEINENSNKCEFCGAMVSETEGHNNEAYKAEENETALTNIVENEEGAYNESDDDGKKYNNIIMVMSVVIVAFFAVICVKNILGSIVDSGSQNIVYVSGDSLYFKANIGSKKEPIKVYEFENDYLAAKCRPQISPDGRNIYFLSDKDNKGRYVLSKIKIVKLRRNIEKNKKHLITVDEDTNGEYYLLDKKEQVLYYRDDELVFKKDKKETVIDEDIIELRISNDNKNIAYITKDGDLYSYSLAKKKANKIDKNINVNGSLEFICGKDENVIYSKNGNYYVYTGKKEVEKIDEDLIIYFTNDMDNMTKTALRSVYLEN